MIFLALMAVPATAQPAAPPEGGDETRPGPGRTAAPLPSVGRPDPAVPATAAGALGIEAPEAEATLPVDPATGAAAAGALGIAEPEAAREAATRQLTVGVLDDAPPFSAIGRFGVRTGFDVEVARSLCDRLAARCTLLPLAADDLVPALRERRIDVAVAAPIVGGRIDSGIATSAPYVSLEVRTVTATAPRGTGADVPVVGVLAGTAQADVLAASGAADAVVLHPSNEDMWIDLALGRLDAVLAPAVTAQREFLSTPLGRGFHFGTRDVATEAQLSRPAAVALRAGDGELRAAVDDAVAEFVASADYVELLDRLLGGLASAPGIEPR